MLPMPMAAWSIFISAVVYRTLTWRRLLYAAYDTLESTSAILIIVSAAAMFGWIMAVEQLPQTTAKDGYPGAGIRRSCS